MDIKVGILAIGNEVVEGQIANRNAAWLSQELCQIGAQPLYHISCRDHKVEIPEALNFLAKNCQLIIVTGGLGPTKDDFTRKSLSDWSNKKLVLNEKAWSDIKKKLEHRNVTLREGHKNQAYSPEGSTLLQNDTGVAPGFFSKIDSGFLASLPGPPSELQPMFTQHLKPLIIENLKPKNDQKLYTWICFGAPESEVAHIVESLIGNQFEIGFRLHKPYVEVKIWAPFELKQKDLKLFQLMESKLGSWLVARDIHSIRQSFHDFLKKYNKVFVVDHISNGLFLEKLREETHSEHIRYQCFEPEGFRFFTQSEVLAIHKSMPLLENQLLISLFPASETSAFVSFNDQIKLFEAPRKVSIRSDLGKHYIIENCFLTFGLNNG